MIIRTLKINTTFTESHSFLEGSLYLSTTQVLKLKHVLNFRINDGEEMSKSRIPILYLIYQRGRQ